MKSCSIPVCHTLGARITRGDLPSAFTESVKDFETILVDDDSPDKTRELAERCANGSNKTRVIRRLKDHGLTPSIQEGINAARCEVVAWMD